MPEYACVCTRSNAVGGGMHKVGLQSVDTQKEEEKATTYFFRASLFVEAVAVEEYVLKC